MKFCLGTAQFGSKYGLDKTYYKNIDIKFKNIIDWNRKNKFFKYIDTAYNYGKSERIIGKHLSQNDNLKIISKISFDNDLTLDGLKINFYKSLNYLNKRKIYGLLIHDKSMFNKKKINSTLKFLDYIKKKKLVKKIGLSVYNRKELDKNLQLFDFNIIQLPINLFNQSFLKDGYLKSISEKYEIFARSIFLQGLLLQDINNLNEYFLKYEDIFIKYHKFLKFNDLSPLEACISFLCSVNINLNVIFGVNNANHIKLISKTINNIENKKIKNIDFSKLNSNKTKLVNPSLWKISV